ncbi:MAG: transposase [Actinobacteria bacterium]|nr:transposase [Actinomycetota bacterium]
MWSTGEKPLGERRHRCENCGLDLDRDLFSAFLMRHVKNENGHQELDLDAARAELLGNVMASTTWEQEGVLATLPLKRQDIGTGSDETLSEQEKRQVRHRHLPGRRSLVRIRKRYEAKAKAVSDRAVRSKDGVVAVTTAMNQPSPTAKVA